MSSPCIESVKPDPIISQYDIIRFMNTLEETNNLGSEQIILNDGCIYVARSLNCKKEGHSINPITVMIPFFNSIGLKVVSLPALCCQTCKKIYIGIGTLSTIPRRFQYARSFLSITGTELNSIPHDDPSILGKCGYKANLPEEERLSILKQIIDFRVMGKDTKDSVCRFLKYLSEKGFQIDSRPTYKSDLEKIADYCGDSSLHYFDSI